MTTYTLPEVRGLVALRLQEKGAALRLARDLGVSPTYVTYVRQGKRKPSRKILTWLGLERQIVYRARG